MSNPIITLTGRVGQDPSTIGSGIRFRMVTADRGKNDAGQWEDRDTSWWTIKAWKNLADQAKSVIKQGQEVTVVGTIREESWNDKVTGEKRTAYEVIASSIAITSFSLSKNLVAVNNVNSNNDIWDTNLDTPF